MVQPTGEERGDREPGGLDRRAVLDLTDQAGGFDLCLSLRALERMPAPLAHAGFGISRVDHDCPMTRRAFADVALHDDITLVVLRMGSSEAIAMTSSPGKRATTSMRGFFDLAVPNSLTRPSRAEIIPTSKDRLMMRHSTSEASASEASSAATAFLKLPPPVIRHFNLAGSAGLARATVRASAFRPSARH